LIVELGAVVGAVAEALAGTYAEAVPDVIPEVVVDAVAEALASTYAAVPDAIPEVVVGAVAEVVVGAVAVAVTGAVAGADETASIGGTETASTIVSASVRAGNGVDVAWGSAGSLARRGVTLESRLGNADLLRLIGSRHNGQVAVGRCSTHRPIQLRQKTCPHTVITGLIRGFVKQTGHSPVEAMLNS